MMALALSVASFMAIAGLRWPARRNDASVAPLISDLEDGLQNAVEGDQGDEEGRQQWSKGTSRLVGPRTYGDFRRNVAYAGPHTKAVLQGLVLTDDTKVTADDVPLTTLLGVRRDLVLSIPWADAGPHMAQGRPGQDPREGSETVKVPLSVRYG
jgi:hypothetical protein